MVLYIGAMGTDRGDREMLKANQKKIKMRGLAFSNLLTFPARYQKAQYIQAENFIRRFFMTKPIKCRTRRWV